MADLLPWFGMVATLPTRWHGSTAAQRPRRAITRSRVGLPGLAGTWTSSPKPLWVTPNAGRPTARPRSRLPCGGRLSNSDCASPSRSLSRSVAGSSHWREEKIAAQASNLIVLRKASRGFRRGTRHHRVAVAHEFGRTTVPMTVTDKRAPYISQSDPITRARRLGSGLACRRCLTRRLTGMGHVGSFGPARWWLSFFFISFSFFSF
jgi:hypothetical protein